MGDVGVTPLLISIAVKCGPILLRGPASPLQPYGFMAQRLLAVFIQLPVFLPKRCLGGRRGGLPGP